VVGRSLRIGTYGRRRDAQASAQHAEDLPQGQMNTRAAAISLPMTVPEIRTVASSGFPLWEPLPVMELRNHRITLAYGDLSQQLARLVARTEDPHEWDANWCTFATWSSKTIGTCIDRQPEHGLLLHMVRHLPLPLRHLVFSASERLLSRGHGAIYRTLAIGNRLVFLEIGTAVGHFVDSFGAAPDSSPSPSFETYWSDMAVFLEQLSHLDPSWVAVDPPDPRTLQAGMQAYHAALSEKDVKAKAELVLLGNLLLGAYEQARVDTYLTATLSFFTLSWLHRIIRGPKPGFSALLARAMAAPVSTLYSLFATRFFLVIDLPKGRDEMTTLKVGRPIPPIDDDTTRSFPALLREVANPELQALLTRYDLSGGRAARTRATNWAIFADRMNYITNLFRSRQQMPELFRSPWPVDVAEQLLAGELPL
jgi:hypothetical protein